MTAPDPDKQKIGRAKLNLAFKDFREYVGYPRFRESFYDRPNGASPRITSIAVRQLDSGNTLSF